MARLILGVVLALAATFVLGSVALAQPKPEFKLGFKALADQIPEIAGEPLENERWGANGDSLQQTSKGLMAWRKADNWTAFTNGSVTWINGPSGLQSRPNNQRFPWEAVVPAAEPGWSVYDKAEFSLSLPSRWQELPMDAKTLGEILAAVEDDNPEMASLLGKQAATLIAAGCKFFAFDVSPAAARSDFPANVNVLTQPLLFEVSMDYFAQTNLSQLERLDMVVKPIAHRRVTTKAGAAEEFRYQMRINDSSGESITVSMTQYALAKGKNAYVVTFSTLADQATEYATTFEKIGLSFKLD